MEEKMFDRRNITIIVVILAVAALLICLFYGFRNSYDSTMRNYYGTEGEMLEDTLP